MYVKVTHTYDFFEPYAVEEKYLMPSDINGPMNVLDVMENTSPKEFNQILQLLKEI